MGVARTTGGSSVTTVLYGSSGTLAAASGGVRRRVQIGIQALRWASGASVCVPGINFAFLSLLSLFLVDARRCKGSFMLYWLSYDYRIAMCSYLVRLKDSRIVENTPGMPCTVTGLIGWRQATESNSGCHTACRV